MANLVWQINRSTRKLLIITTNLDGRQITDDMPNSPNIPPTKHSHYMVYLNTAPRTWSLHVAVCMYPSVTVRETI